MEWLIAGSFLLILFLYALVERRAEERKSREAWDRSSTLGRTEPTEASVHELGLREHAAAESKKAG